MTPLLCVRRVLDEKKRRAYWFWIFRIIWKTDVALFIAKMCSLDPRAKGGVVEIRKGNVIFSVSSAVIG